MYALSNPFPAKPSIVFSAQKPFYSELFLLVIRYFLVLLSSNLSSSDVNKNKGGTEAAPLRISAFDTMLFVCECCLCLSEFSVSVCVCFSVYICVCVRVYLYFWCLCLSTSLFVCLHLAVELVSVFVCLHLSLSVSVYICLYIFALISVYTCHCSFSVFTRCT